MTLRFGLALPHYDFSAPDGSPVTLGAVVDWARRAELLGFDSVWMSDHLFLDLKRYGGGPQRFGSVEPLAALSAIAPQTSRVRLGTLVLCYAFRNPVMLAKEATAIDLASEGRLDLGIGAGWYEAEFQAMGIPFVSTGDRIAALDEYLQVVAGLLEGSPLSFSGRAYSVRDAVNTPGPAQKPRPPIWIGSKGGPRMLRLIAERADGWNVVWRIALDDYRAKVDTLARACERAGRDPKAVRRSVGFVTVIGENEKDLAARWETVRRWTPGGAIDGVAPDDWKPEGLVGTPQECISRLQEFEALGVEEIILSFSSLPFAVADPEMVDIFAERVAPAFR